MILLCKRVRKAKMTVIDKCIDLQRFVFTEMKI